jgi:hypothetical protein
MAEIDPSQLDQLISELYSTHTEETANFQAHFSEDVAKVCVNLSAAWTLLLKSAESCESIEQRSLVCNFLYYMIESCFSSTKLLSIGFIAASGNIFRQSVESMFMAILCSHTGELTRKENRKETSFNFYQHLIGNKPHTQAHLASGHVERNAAVLSVNSLSIANMAKVRSFYNDYSHVSARSIRSKVTGENQEIFLFGGGFHEGQKDQYHNELQSRILYSGLFDNFLKSIDLRIRAIPASAESSE